MSPEFRSVERLSPRESQIVSVVRQYEVPLLRKAWQRWGEQVFSDGSQRGWFVCGPTGRSATRILNWKTNIPLSPDADIYTQEHIRISKPHLYYDPKTGEPPVDHEFVSYFDGKGSVLHIDPVYDLLWGDKQGLKGADELRGAIHVAKFRVGEYKQALHDIYHLVPEEENPELLAQIVEQGVFPMRSDIEAKDRYLVIYTDDLTHSVEFMGSSGNVYETDVGGYSRYGPPLGDFIREIIPEWSGLKK